jgi:hypothetical protein
MLKVARDPKHPVSSPSRAPGQDGAELLEKLGRLCEAQEREMAQLQAISTQVNALTQAQLESTRLTILGSDPKYSDPARLSRCEFKVFSQFGEDGALQEIFRRIGVNNRHFVEFGVEGGLENNTALLLLQGWSGLWIEPVREYVSAIETGLAPVVRSGRLKVLNELVKAENVEQLFAAAAVPAEPDLLSIDIDGNDYWVWRSIKRYRPRVVVIEYNAAFPPPVEWVMPHDPGYRWNGTAKFGASLESFTQLGAARGYALVGCGLGGANAFFVRLDLVGEHFAGPFTAANHYEPPRYFLLGRQAGHPRSYELFI